MWRRIRRWPGRVRAAVSALARLEASTADLQEASRSLREVSEALAARQDHLRMLSEADVRRIMDTLSGVEAQIAGVHGITSHTQVLAGDTLATANEHRSRGLHVNDLMRQAIGRMETRQIGFSARRPWHEYEFRVYSQFGEDGLVQYLVREIGDLPHRFVEFGVEDYQEANTRFLILQDRSWSGLVIDSSEDNIAAIRHDEVYRRCELAAVRSWITRENIDSLLRDNGFSGELGLLSIDIDGNDYWVWEAIRASNPVIVIIEYNYRFGADAAVVVPYAADFAKTAAHASGVYYGASLSALVTLGRRMGYAFVGCCSGGVNAFFVRRDRLPATVPEVSAHEGYVAGHHVEMRDLETGVERKATLLEQQELLLSLPLISVSDHNA